MGLRCQVWLGGEYDDDVNVGVESDLTLTNASSLI